MMSVNLGNITILNIKDSDYQCFLRLIRASQAENLIKKAGLTKKSRAL